MKERTEQSKISWKRILIFIIIATAISNIFRFDIFELKEGLKLLPTWIFILTVVLLESSGVFIAALIAIFLLKKERKTEMSLFGTSKLKGLLMAVIPIIILTIIRVNNEFDMNTHLYGFVSIIGTLIYSIMEEYGWRGYLQEELQNIKPWQKYLAIGFLWYFWHLSFLTDASIGENLFFLTMLIIGSWGIGQIAESTKSILASACFHLIVQIMTFNTLIKDGIGGTEKLIILGVSVILWVVIIKKWEKENTIAKTV